MKNTDRQKLLLSQVMAYISDNEETFSDIEDRETYLNFLFNLSQNIDTDINIEMLEDSNDRWGQANIYKNWYTIVLTNSVLDIEIESESDFVNYIMELEEEAGKINLSVIKK